jgi:2-polyprenyl-3-methyl-5-hydroxy-6-metoxy-1,4-benzoquinol methylase
MIDVRQRSREPELLDLGVPRGEMEKSLADLRFVNRRLSNSDRLVRTVAGFLEGLPRPRLLDVGCGSGDLLDRIRRESPLALLAVGADIKVEHLRLAPSPVTAVAGRVERLPFAAESFDVVMASHFLHHFDSPALPGILSSLHGLARRALVINDLQRSRVPYLFGRVAFPLLFTSRVSVNDGLVSIRRGFRDVELAAAFAEAGVPVRIERCWPYRLLAIAERGTRHRASA